MNDPAADLDRAKALSRFHMRVGDGTLLSGAAAFVALWRTLPGWRLPARACSGQRRLKTLDWLYDRFLLVRPHVSKRLAVMRRRRMTAMDVDG